MSPSLQDKLRNKAGKWLFLMREAEPEELVLNQRRVFVLPSKAGWGFAAMLLALFIASINYNLSLGFGFTFLIGACAVIDMHLTFRNLAHLILRTGRRQPVFAGEEAQFTVHLVNQRRQARYALWIGFRGEGQPEIEQAIDIAAESTADVILSAPARERGWLEMPRIRLQTRFPLGLVRAWSYWKPRAAVLVYPKPEENAPPLPVSMESDSTGQGKIGLEDDFAGIRTYQAGDSMRRLAWRQIARLDADANGPLVAKHFEGGNNGKLRIDMNALPRSMDVEAKLSRLTRWVLEAEARGMPYEFRLGQVAIDSGIGPSHQETCLRALALYGKPG